MRLSFFILVLLLLIKIGQAQVVAQDGKAYKTIRIGSQTWMAENLNVIIYRNGDSIPQVQDPKVWSNLKTGAWCYYEGKRESGKSYGRLYNWYAVSDPRGLAPAGWHVSTDAEWTDLTKFLGGRIGTSLKIKSSKGWNGAGNGTDELGFSAMPGGTRSIELFSFAGYYGYWWTSTEFDSYSAWNRFLGYNNNDIGRSTGWKQFGSSVRCVKDGAENGISKTTQFTAEGKSDTALPKDDFVKNERATAKEDAGIASIDIGEQIWMTQNLSVTKFQNGDAIPEARTDSEWTKAGELKQPAWCFYNNDTVNGEKYGRLYNWYAVNDKRGLAPKGWHIADASEWNKLSSDLGGERAAGAKLKSGDTGFAGLLPGFRDSDGQFHSNDIVGYWWASAKNSTSAWCFSINYISDAFNSNNSGDKQKGFSVRCIRD